MARATRSHDIVSATTVTAYQERFNIRGNLLKFFLADNNANEEQDPIHSLPMANAEDRRKRKTLDISRIHRIPRKKKVNHSNVEEETERDAQFSAIQRRCKECRVEGE